MDWTRKFKIITNEMGTIPQQRKADMLYVVAGGEIQEIITAKNMLPHSEHPSSEPIFDILMKKLDDHFKSLSDPSVNLMLFENIKQGKDEGARDFQVRVLRLAALCGMDKHELVLKERFIKGLQNAQLAEAAYVYNWSMEETAAAAARKEAWKSDGDKRTITSPLLVDGEKLLAAIENRSKDDRTNRFTPIQRGSGNDNRYRGNSGRRENSDNRGSLDRRGEGNFDKRRPGYQQQTGSQQKDTQRCRNCGIMKHNKGVCPALGKECRQCGKTGHFQAVCQSRVNTLDAVDSDFKKETAEDKVNIFT